MKVALATSSNYPVLSGSEESLPKTFQEASIDAEVVVWDDASTEWSDFTHVIIRSCWDYHLRAKEFLDWIAMLEQSGIKVCNSPNLIRWNAHKSYLFDLHRRGVRIPFTHIVTKYDEIKPVLTQFTVGSAVIKPANGASAFGVQKFAFDDEYLPSAIDKLLEHSGVLVQEYIDEVKLGEISAVFLGNEFSHTVKKLPDDGDFRSNHEYGGRVEGTTLSNDMLRMVKDEYVKCDVDSLYARFDFVPQAGVPVLMELELIEPYLFFEYGQNSSQIFVKKFLDAFA